ncbi:MAG: bifunctional YncE family protein/alkaline phosphatase family protein [Nitrospirae bacterium]|nr:bifunctional YncE family protein/alkaline phosphatase family protein [Nitrospirota bacterium]
MICRRTTDGAAWNMARGYRRMGPSAKNLVFANALLIFFLACTSKKKECPLPEPAPIATAPVGDLGDGTYKLYTGRRITPIGRHLEVGTFPQNLALSPSGKLLAISHSGESDEKNEEKEKQTVWIVDAATMTTLKIIQADAFFYGLAFSPDSKLLYASGGGGNTVHVYDVTSPTYREVNPLKVEDYPSGVAATPDGKLLLVARLHEHTLSVFKTGTYEKLADLPTQAYPYGVAVTPDSTKAFVSNWGDSSISAFDLTSLKPLGRIEVGKNPEGLAVSPDGKSLVSSNADADSLSFIDTATLEVTRTLSLRARAEDAPGVMPVDLTFSPDGSRLLVACSGDNMIAVVDVADGKIIGKIPSGAYPTSVRTDGKSLYILNGKAFGARPNLKNEFITSIVWGHLSSVDMPSEADLPSLTAKVDENNEDRLKHFFGLGPECQATNGPVPIRHGDKSAQIKHVVYVVRENKTYDSLLGDLGGEARGEPSFALFGEKITPNLHSLARRYANLDNCYYESEQSLQGHIWISGGWTNDFAERNWTAMWAQKGVGQFFLPNTEPAARGGEPLFYDNLIKHDVSFRVYGDPTGILTGLFDTFRNNIDFKYPTWSIQIRDQDKIKEFFRELDLGIFPSFVSIWLPNDHTRGTSAGAPTPETMISDNDYATGLLIEKLSKSPYWKETVVFIFEDDPQGVPDHIDAHRGPCLVVGPQVKRGYTSHVHYSFPSFHRTVELILGMQPLSRFDALAAPILDVFTQSPENSEPFTPVAPDVPVRYNAPDAYGAAESAKMDFSTADQAPGLGRVLWHHMKGPKVPFPSAYADEDDD